MTKPKLTPTQQRVLDAMKSGAVLKFSAGWKGSLFLENGRENVSWKTVKALLRGGLIREAG